MELKYTTAGGEGGGWAGRCFQAAALLQRLRGPGAPALEAGCKQRTPCRPPGVLPACQPHIQLHSHVGDLSPAHACPPDLAPVLPLVSCSWVLRQATERVPRAPAAPKPAAPKPPAAGAAPPKAVLPKAVRPGWPKAGAAEHTKARLVGCHVRALRAGGAHPATKPPSKGNKGAGTGEYPRLTRLAKGGG